MINKRELEESGFTIIDAVYSKEEIAGIVEAIRSADSSGEAFRKSSGLFAIRQFLKEFPDLSTSIFNEKLKQVISELPGSNYFLVKSIYFDKPERSNWFVAYHQDLMIAVDKKISADDYGPWTDKQGQFAVQPPIAVLSSIFTIRIHLDDTDENNGALKVIAGSHRKGIVRPETINLQEAIEDVCPVPSGGIMIMRPLLMHSSARTVNNSQRRVIHIELSDATLHGNLNWSEKMEFL
ncbi:MAG: phytanoyl-CoA dioxygenase [Bacteroidetes bacterium]|nr:phytanoyl-CoA dioxygenase [Bacteroidota bacterium]